LDHVPESIDSPEWEMWLRGHNAIDFVSFLCAFGVRRLVAYDVMCRQNGD
jgi:hypothetical protein